MSRRRGAPPCPPWHTWGQACVLFARGATTRAALPVALLVGTVLTAANEGAQLTSGQLRWSLAVKTAVNYATPFVVASFGYLTGGRRERDLEGPGAGGHRRT